MKICKFIVAACFYLDPDLLVRCSLTRSFPIWMNELANDFDSKFILNETARGFRLVPDITVVKASESVDYESALESGNKELLDELFREELELGRITIQQEKPIKIQAIGAISKSGTTALRPITDCSRPLSNSLNSYITSVPFKFEGIDDVLKQSVPNGFYAIVDIKAAYWHVPVHPPHRQLQGFKWRFGNGVETYLVDNFLCFGLANGPEIFHRISSAIARRMRYYGFNIVSYLDDFLLVCVTKEECTAAQNCLIALLVRLGFAIKWEKLVTPPTRVQFLSIIIDSDKQQLELPYEKLSALVEMCAKFSGQ